MFLFVLFRLILRETESQNGAKRIRKGLARIKFFAVKEEKDKLLVETQGDIVEKQRLKRYEGRVQFFAVKEEVEKLIAAGYGYKMIHDQLVATGKITMQYDTFYNYLRPKKGVLSRPQPPPPKNSDGKLGQSTTPLFKHDPNPDPEKIFGPGWNTTKG